MSDYYHLGTYSRKVTTDSPDAQLWFDRGLMWLYAYNHAAAVDCFRKALDHDPTCVMAHWGVAYGVGCNYNKKWGVFTPEMVADTMQQARSAIGAGYRHLDKATAVEAALIQAVEKRFQKEGEHAEELLESWNGEYANAMRQVYQVTPNDWDVATLFAEALINRTPWQLWNLETGQPADGADTGEAIEVLERALTQMEEANAEAHPGCCTSHPCHGNVTPSGKGLYVRDQLRATSAGRRSSQHMPSHIDILCGDYYNAVVANQRAIEVDNVFARREGESERIHLLSRAAQYPLQIYAAMLLGQYKTAMEAVEEMAALAHEDLLRVEQSPMADQLEGMLSMKVHVLIRFGKWHEILEQPFPNDKNLYCNTTAMLHYARAIALATLHHFDEAEAEREAFRIAEANVPDTRYIFNNTSIDILKVAEAMMSGEVDYHKGHYESAFEQLRLAVYLDDHLNVRRAMGLDDANSSCVGGALAGTGAN